MALSFSVKFYYSQTTHKIEYDHTNMYVKLRSDSSTIRTWGLGGGIDIRFNTGTTEYEIGTISGWNGSFNRTFDFNLSTAALQFDDTNLRIVGSDDINNGGVTKYTYGVSHTTCPVHIIKDLGTGIVTIKCPCDTSNCATSPMNTYYAEV